MHLVIMGIIIVITFITVNDKLHKVNYNTVVGKVIGFEPTYTIGLPQMSPVLSYNINGKEYKCTMYLLTCTDNLPNRLQYMNKEYTLFYDEKYPNRVTLKKDNSQAIIIFALIIFIQLIFFVIMVGNI